MDINQERSNAMATTHTQAAGIAVQSQTQTAEGRNLMGANRTQGLGVTAFLLGFTALAGGVYSGKVLLYLVGVALMAGSVLAFRKVKPLENPEN
jgi:hypothetical protein